MNFFWWQNSQIFITYIASTTSLDPIFGRNELYSELSSVRLILLSQQMRLMKIPYLTIYIISSIFFNHEMIWNAQSNKAFK